jgi:trimeric autotransporter adhesin
MSNRIPSLGAFINSSKSNLFNTYQAGSGVGGISSSNRSALRRRATLKSGTMTNPKSGVCQGLCDRVQTAGGEVLVTNDGFLFLMDDDDWNTVVATVGSDASGVPVIPNAMTVNTIPDYQGSGKTRVQVIFTYSHTTANNTGFTMDAVTTLLASGGHANIYNIEITQWGSIPFANTGEYFSGWKGKNSATDKPLFLNNSNLTSAFKDVDISSVDFGNISSWDVSQVNDMSNMFDWATNFNEDLSNWDTSKVTNMNDAFINSDFNQNINNWNTSNVTNMSGMFAHQIIGKFNQPLNNWQTGKVTNMYAMFQGATTFNQPLNNWDVSVVTNMQSMFQNATNFNQLLNNWDVSGVTDMVKMFNNATSFNQDLGDWTINPSCNVNNMFLNSPMDNSYNINTSRSVAGWLNTNNNGASGAPSTVFSGVSGWPGALYDFSYVFLDNATFKTAGQSYPPGGGATYGPVAGWNVSRLINMSEGFKNRGSFNEDISLWDTASCTNMSILFGGIGIASMSFNQDIGNWNVSNVTNMSQMFYRALAFNQNISSWNVSNVSNMSQMFYHANAFNQNISSWNVSNVTNMSSMFERAINFNQPIGTWNVSNVSNMNSLFKNGANNGFNQDISGWNVSNVTSMSAMFENIPFNKDIGAWNVSNVTNMSNMFNASIFDKNISSWNVSNVTDMNNMFNGSSFDGDLSSWNVYNVTNMSSMFYGSLFGSYSISGWNISSVTTFEDMFTQTSFNQDLSSWNLSHRPTITNMFDPLNGSLSSTNNDAIYNAWITPGPGWYTAAELNAAGLTTP